MTEGSRPSGTQKKNTEGASSFGHSSSVPKEEDPIKKNTDCVDFLASPFTCNKPTDGGHEPYLNPAGVFPNHPPPPLRGYNRNTPCYFFFSNGYCKHGETCWFMHGRGPAAPPAHVSSPDCIEIAVESDAPLPAEDSSDDSLNTESPQRTEEGQVEKDGNEQEGESTRIAGNGVKYHRGSGSSSDGKDLKVNDRTGMDLREQSIRKYGRMNVHQTSPVNRRSELWDPSLWEEDRKEFPDRRRKQSSTPQPLQSELLASTDPYSSNKMTSCQDSVISALQSTGPKSLDQIVEQRGEARKTEPLNLKQKRMQG